ncbi:MAG TPA: ABC transporter permease [Myxococcota bacterium]|nr:ABC transporter permease [Myxococcota bacterium]
MRSVPRLLAVPALGAAGLIGVPLLALVWRAPWAELAAQLASPAAREALGLSLWCSLSATALSFVLGVPLAWLLARTAFPGQRLVRALVTLPMVLPPVVGGVALLLAFGRRGLLGAWLAALGVTLPFTTAGAVLAETFVALPFLVVAAEAGFRQVDSRLEEAAAVLGARPGFALRRVTLPLAAPALRAGAALCWARALGEFGATITFAGSFPGRTQTLPLAVYLALEHDPDAAVALSLVLLVVSVAALVALRDRWLGV